MNFLNGKKNIAKNTMLLYIRMFFTMLISLYTSRVILSSLGVTDYGIYNAVGGFIILFSSITNSFSVSISRFLTFELGNKENKLNEIFSTAVIIQIILGLFIVILVETFGVWFLNTQMVIPQERIFSANCVLQLSLITLFISLLSVPYNAVIIAEERMGAFAFIGIFEAFIKLLIAFVISYSSFDKLILYSTLMMFASLLVRSIYTFYCKKHFDYSRLKILIEKKLLLKMLNFAGWNFIGASSAVFRDHGVNVLLNVFCGPVINASRGIAMQVCSAVSSFSNNFITAINPQITKQYASGNILGSFDLVFKGSKLAFFLMLIFTVPIIIETPTILSLWLVSVPEFSVIFVRLILLYVLVESVSYTMINLMLAGGNIKTYQLVVGGIQMLNFPLAYIFLRMGMKPETTVEISIVLAFFCMFFRLKMLSKLLNFPALDFIKSVLSREILTFIVIFILSYLLCVENLQHSFVVLISNVMICLSLSTLIIYFVGCDNFEKKYINKKIKNIIKYYA